MIGAIALGVIATTAGRRFVDVSGDVAPKHFVVGEWWTPIAALAASVWVFVYRLSSNLYIAAAVALVIAYVVRVSALWSGWEGWVVDGGDQSRAGSAEAHFAPPRRLPAK